MSAFFHHSGETKRAAGVAAARAVSCLDRAVLTSHPLGAAGCMAGVDGRVQSSARTHEWNRNKGYMGGLGGKNGGHAEIANPSILVGARCTRHGLRDPGGKTMNRCDTSVRQHFAFSC